MASAADWIIFRLGRRREIARRTAKLKTEWQDFIRQSDGRFPLDWQNRKLMLWDASPSTDFDRHYVYHIGWAVRQLMALRPSAHLDIGSSLYFAAAASAICPVTFADIRPPRIEIAGLTVLGKGLEDLDYLNGTIESLSCLHVLEHFGLGRYGDKLDAKGDLKGAAGLIALLKPGGTLLLALPLAEKPAMRWNAHRIYSYEMVGAMFAGLMEMEFYLIPDRAETGGILSGEAARAALAGQRYACGCWLFKKPL